MSSLLTDGDALEHCPNCLHTISIDGLNDEDCECYCHQTLEEMVTWLQMIEERRG